MQCVNAVKTIFLIVYIPTNLMITAKKWLTYNDTFKRTQNNVYLNYYVHFNTIKQKFKIQWIGNSQDNNTENL